MRKKKRMVIVYAMTRNIYECLKPSLTSLLEHNSPKKIYILAEDDELPYEVPKFCEIINVSGQQYFPKNGPNRNSIYTYMAMMRACYTDLLPNEDKILQLDIDTIICDSLEPLWDIDLEGKWFAACPEYLGKYNPWNNPVYYNIGVCMYNLAEMRKDDAQNKMVNFMNHNRLWCVEQDALQRFACPDKATEIPLRYNECFCCGYTDDPAVVHYAGTPNWYTNHTIKRREYLDKYLK